MYKYLFFDFDGTLFNSYPRMISSMRKSLFESRGIEYDYDEMFKMCMVSLGHLGRELNVTKSEWERYTEIVMNDETLPKIAPYEETVELFEELKKMGIQSFMYTNRDQLTYTYLSEYQLDKYIVDSIISARKPDPTLLDAMIEKYHLDKKECLVVGDRTLDLQGALASNIDSYSIRSYKEEPLAKAQGQDYNDLLNFLKIYSK